jgi:hypothetical protein
MGKPLFESERTYTRKEIYNVLGGDLVSNYPSDQGRVLYCCVSQYWNPDAPEIILIGRLEKMAEAAKQFASQNEAVPVFLKQGRRRNGKWVYRGEFMVERYSNNRAEIAPFIRKACKEGVAGVLLLRQVRA